MRYAGSFVVVVAVVLSIASAPSSNSSYVSYGNPIEDALGTRAHGFFCQFPDGESELWLWIDEEGRAAWRANDDVLGSWEVEGSWDDEDMRFLIDFEDGSSTSLRPLAVVTAVPGGVVSLLADEEVTGACNTWFLEHLYEPEQNESRGTFECPGDEAFALDELGSYRHAVYFDELGFGGADYGVYAIDGEDIWWIVDGDIDHGTFTGSAVERLGDTCSQSE